MNLADFLKARIDEDEGEARYSQALAMTGEFWKHYPERAYDELQHLTLTTTRRVLAECEAKRRIVEAHAPIEDRNWLSGAENTGNEYLWCASCGTLDDSPEPFPCPTLRILAAVYSDHPDYDEAWRP